MSAAESISSTLERRLGCSVRSARPVAGGDINDALRVETDRGSLFVKTRPAAERGTYAAEAAGLEWLGEPGPAAAGELGVPKVVLVHDPCPDSADDGDVRFLALEWIERGSLSAEGEGALGRGLAAVHAAGAPAFGFTPAAAPSRFGPVTLPNDESAAFAEFWRDCRIEPLLRQSGGALGVEGEGLVRRVAERLPELVGPPEPPSRTHGDLWSGNAMADAAGTPYLIDPAAHGGHREVDLATLRVFGGPSRRCFDAYAEVAPLADGWQGRIALFQLEIVLLHVALFGGAYAQQAIEIARRYA